MPAGSEQPPLNPFAAELRRAAAGAAAPDKAPSLRELSSVSGVGRSAIGDWLAGKSLPRSWDDGAVLVVDAIIKLATRYGKRFADEEAVRQRCKDAYDRARKAQQENSITGSGTPLPEIAATATPTESASRYTTADEPDSEEPESGTASVRRWRSRYSFLAVSIFTVLVVVVCVALILLLHPTNCLDHLDQSSNTPWGTGEIHVCVGNGEGNYYGSIQTLNKELDDSCVRWRIIWDGEPPTYSPKACTQGVTNFKRDTLKDVSRIQGAILEKVPPPTGMLPTSP